MVEVVSRAGIEDLHHIRASAERADWEAAANDLAHRRQVGTNAQDLLEAADGKPEGYNLVADEERPTLVGQASRCREVLGVPVKTPVPVTGSRMIAATSSPASSITASSWPTSL